MMTPQTVMRESEERGEEKDVEGSTSTNVLVYDVIDTIKHVDNDYTIAEAVVVGINPLMLQTVVPLGVVATVWE